MLGIVLQRITILFVFIIIMNLESISSVPQMRVIAGRDTEPGEFPYVLRLEVLKYEWSAGYATWFRCTVAALTATWVLTAAHCVRDVKKTIFIKYKGYGQPASKEKSSKVISNHTMPAYRDFESDQYNFLHNDIAILKTEPMQLTEFGKLCAVDFKALSGQAVKVVGFGDTLEGSVISDTKALKKPLQVTTAIIRDCDNMLYYYPFMCLVPRCGQTGRICSGDSGGPVIHASGIVGVNSWGEDGDCFIEDLKEEKFSGVTGAVTPVSPYLGWISNIIMEDEKHKPSL